MTACVVALLLGDLWWGTGEFVYQLRFGSRRELAWQLVETFALAAILIGAGGSALRLGQRRIGWAGVATVSCVPVLVYLLSPLPLFWLLAWLAGSLATFAFLAVTAPRKEPAG